MKIEIESDLSLDVSFNPLNNLHGYVISFYFVSGTRYQYWAEHSSIGSGQMSFMIEDSKDEDLIVGRVVFEGEDEEEREMINHSTLWHCRDKETDTYLLLPFNFENSTHQEKTFVRHNW